jgi:hypothetical protein
MEKLNTALFIINAKKIHEDKYDYSLVEYKNSRTKVSIICPEHGIFLQKPVSHINSKCGCNICSGSFKKTQDCADNSNLIQSNDFNDISNTNFEVKNEILDNRNIYQMSNKVLIEKPCILKPIKYYGSIKYPNFYKIEKKSSIERENKQKIEKKKLNISTRNFPLKPDEIKKKHKISDGGNVFAFFTTTLENEKIVLLCTKI